MEKDRLLAVAHALISTLKKKKFEFEISTRDPMGRASPLILTASSPADTVPPLTIGGRKLVNTFLNKKSLPIGSGWTAILKHINKHIIPRAELKLRVAVPGRRLARRWSNLSLELSPEDIAKKLNVPLQLEWDGGSWKVKQHALLANLFPEQTIDLILEPYRDLQDPPSPVRKMAARIATKPA